MRGILRHHPSDGRRRSGTGSRLFHRRTSGPAAPAPTSGTAAAPALRDPAPPPTGEPTPGLDFAARRVRAAGGPSDEASYTCACGYVFCAPVSATVACPHCGCEQDW